MYGHVAYYNPSISNLHEFRYFQLDVYPLVDCREPRYVTDENGATKPRCVFYHIPARGWLTDFYVREDLVSFMYNDLEATTFPQGHIEFRRSPGWRTKVTNNPNINLDHRNQPVVGDSDGVPLFEDKLKRTSMDL